MNEDWVAYSTITMIEADCPVVADSPLENSSQSLVITPPRAEHESVQFDVESYHAEKKRLKRGKPQA